MSVAIGDSTNYSTWAKLRVAYGLDIARVGTYISSYNSVYLNGLKSAANGSGLIRYGQTVPGARSEAFNQPVIYSDFVPTPPGGYVLYFQGGTGPDAPRAFTVEFKDELLGETITGTGGTVTINTDLFTLTGQSGAGPNLGAILSIGKLTIF